MQNRKGKMCLIGDGAFLTLCDRIKGEGRGANKKKKKTTKKPRGQKMQKAYNVRNSNRNNRVCLVLGNRTSNRQRKKINCVLCQERGGIRFISLKGFQKQGSQRF